jgi:hypothetical protein
MNVFIALFGGTLLGIALSAGCARLAVLAIPKKPLGR